jgi:general secretion pathway protein G
MTRMQVRMKMRMSRGARASRAFTLIELLLVLVIIATLAAVVAPRLMGRSLEAKITGAKADIATIKGALETFETDCSRYPTSEEGLGALLQQPGGLQGWHGPYLDKMPMDPWGHPYIYQCPGTHNTTSFDVSSLGPDGQPSNDDITNWQQ